MKMSRTAGSLIGPALFKQSNRSMCRSGRSITRTQLNQFLKKLPHQTSLIKVITLECQSTLTASCLLMSGFSTIVDKFRITLRLLLIVSVVYKIYSVSCFRSNIASIWPINYKSTKFLFLPRASLVPVDHLNDSLVPIRNLVQQFKLYWDHALLNATPSFDLGLGDLFDCHL